MITSHDPFTTSTMQAAQIVRSSIHHESVPPLRIAKRFKTYGCISCFFLSLFWDIISNDHVTWSIHYLNNASCTNSAFFNTPRIRSAITYSVLSKMADAFGQWKYMPNSISAKEDWCRRWAMRPTGLGIENDTLASNRTLTVLRTALIQRNGDLLSDA